MENSWAAVHIFGRYDDTKLQYVQIHQVKDYFERVKEGQNMFMIELIEKNGVTSNVIGEVLYVAESEEKLRLMIKGKRPKFSNKRRSTALLEYSKYQDKKRKEEEAKLKIEKKNNNLNDDVESLQSNEESDAQLTETKEELDLKESTKNKEPDLKKSKKYKSTKLTQEEQIFKDKLKLYDHNVNSNIISNFNLNFGDTNLSADNKENNLSNVERVNYLKNDTSENQLLQEKLKEAEKQIQILKSQLVSKSSTSKARKQLFSTSVINGADVQQISKKNKKQDIYDEIDGVRLQCSPIKQRAFTLASPFAHERNNDFEDIFNCEDVLSRSSLVPDMRDQQTNDDIQVNKLNASFSINKVFKCQKTTLPSTDSDKNNLGKSQLNKKSCSPVKSQLKKSTKRKRSVDKNEEKDWLELPSPKDVTPSVYVRKLCDAIWGEYDFANRAMHVNKVSRLIPQRSPKRQITPQKAAAVNGCYQKFLRLKYSTKADLPMERRKKLELGNTSDETSDSSSDSSSSSSSD
ncbi:hypothetical protein TKK_0017112 [Trichogramma kaykai]